MPIDLAATYYERDRDSFASVLGAAIALRLFLFLVPAITTAVGLVLLVSGSEAVRSLAEHANLTSEVAGQIETSTRTTTLQALGIFVGSLWLTVWTGRSLTKVLAACSGGAWRMSGRQTKVTVRMAGAVTSLVLLLVVVSALLNRVREDVGLAAATTTWGVTAVVYVTAWFVVTWNLPKRTTDPGSLLPGALLLGLGLTALQWFMQFYLPGKLTRASALSGGIGLAVATLGYMFLIGRLMASSLIVDAIVWERFGSISGVVFSLPVLRRLPARSGRLRRFFDLDRAGTEPPAPPEDAPIVTL